MPRGHIILGAASSARGIDRSVEIHEHPAKIDEKRWKTVRNRPCGWTFLAQASFAKHVGVPRFGLAKLRRCVELPAYVPRVELVPAVAGPKGYGPS